MKKTIESIVAILNQYAEEMGTIPRSTSDLSRLEEWLILRLIKVEIEGE